MKKILLLALASCILSHAQTQNPDQSTIYIFYPWDSQGHHLFLFFNKKKIVKLSPGERLLYAFNVEQSVKVTVLDTDHFIEPRTLGGNTRTIALKKGKDFYFEVKAKKGELHYIIDAGEGKQSFEKASTLQPSSYSYSLKDSIFIR